MAQASPSLLQLRQQLEQAQTVLEEVEMEITIRRGFCWHGASLLTTSL